MAKLLDFEKCEKGYKPFIVNKENVEMRSEYSFLNFIRASKSFLALEVLSFIE